MAPGTGAPDRADESARRNAVEGELLVRFHIDRVVAQAELAERPERKLDPDGHDQPCFSTIPSMVLATSSRRSMACSISSMMSLNLSTSIAL
jgi:hypothetical protein